MNQREQARAIAESLGRQHPSLVYAHRKLVEILQAPPDGSLDSEDRRRLMALSASCWSMSCAVQTACRHLG